MPRTTSEPEIDEFSRAGGLTRARMSDDIRSEQRHMESVARDERRYQDTMARQASTDARAARYEQRADTREERILRSQELDDQLKKARYERELAEEINAKERAIIDEQRAAKATKLLFDIDTKGADAEKRLSEVYRDYGDIISDEKRFPRMKGQWDFNQKNLTFHRTEAEKAAAAAQNQKQLADAAAAGMVRESVTVDGERYARPTTIAGQPTERVTTKRRLPGGGEEAVTTTRPAGSAAAPAPAANQAAVDWLKANPTDPRAAAIKAKLGL